MRRRGDRGGEGCVCGGGGIGVEKGACAEEGG